MLFQNERVYGSEWREVVVLLAGVLYKQRLDKINSLIDSIIGKGPEQATREILPLLARNVGLPGGMVRDLSPFDFKPSNPEYPGILKSVTSGLPLNLDTLRPLDSSCFPSINSQQ
jgi:hypothetical protein